MLSMALLEALMARTRVLDSFAITRILVAILLSLTLLISPLWATPSAAFGTVVFANRARVGGANASAGATLFSGDRLSTDEGGSAQLRAGAPRRRLGNARAATCARDETSPAPTLSPSTLPSITATPTAFPTRW